MDITLVSLQIERRVLVLTDSPWPSSWVGYSSQRYCLASDLPPEACVPSTRVKHDRLYLKSGCVEELVAASLALGESCRLHVYGKE